MAKEKRGHEKRACQVGSKEGGQQSGRTVDWPKPTQIPSIMNVRHVNHQPKLQAAASLERLAPVVSRVPQTTHCPSQRPQSTGGAAPLWQTQSRSPPHPYVNANKPFNCRVAGLRSKCLRKNKLTRVLPDVIMWKIRLVFYFDTTNCSLSAVEPFVQRKTLTSRCPISICALKHQTRAFQAPSAGPTLPRKPVFPF